MWHWVWLALCSGKFLGGWGIIVHLLRRCFPPTRFLRKGGGPPYFSFRSRVLQERPGGLGRGGAAARRPGGAALVARLLPRGSRGPRRAHRVAGVRARPQRPRPFLLALAAPPPPRAASAAGGRGLAAAEAGDAAALDAERGARRGAGGSARPAAAAAGERQGGLRASCTAPSGHRSRGRRFSAWPLR